MAHLQESTWKIQSVEFENKQNSINSFQSFGKKESVRRKEHSVFLKTHENYVRNKIVFGAPFILFVLIVNVVKNNEHAHQPTKYLSIRCWLVRGNGLHWVWWIWAIAHAMRNWYSSKREMHMDVYARTWSTLNSEPQSVCCEYLRKQLGARERGEIHYWFRIECVTLKHWYWIIMGILMDAHSPLSFDTDTIATIERLRSINAFRNLHGFCMNDVLFHAIEVHPK